MGFLILAAFIAIPLIEIWLFVQIGGAIGALPTVAGVVATAVIGMALLRRQGLAALERLQSTLEAGADPVGPVFDGFCLLLAGALLLTPGFFTDALGLLLFLPPVRAALLRLVVRRFVAPGGGGATYASYRWRETRAPGPGGGGEVIEGEWTEVRTPRNGAALPKSGEKPDRD